MKVWNFCLIIALHHTAVKASGQALPHTRCERSYRKLGCFKADSKRLNTLLINDRDQNSPKNDGHALDWNRWNDSIHSLACRCAAAARKNGFKVFGLQNYGECWSGPDADKAYHLDNRSNDCVMILKEPLPSCDMKDPRECMGTGGVNFLYGLDGIYDLGFIIDGSRSVGYYGFVATKMFLLELIEKLDIGFHKTHIGAIVYGGHPQLICSFSDLKSQNSVPLLKLRILGWELPGGDKRTDKALIYAAKYLYSNRGGDRIGVPNVLVVITDGNTAYNSEQYGDVLAPLKDRGVNIIAVGIGDVGRDELIKIAMGRHERVIQIDRIEDLDPVYLREMIYNLC